MGAIQYFPRDKRPVIGKRLLQLRDHRTRHPEMQVLYWLFRMIAQDIPMPDVHATGEGDRSVHHHQLAMVPQIERRCPPGLE